MIEIIKNIEKIDSFVNTIWVTLDDNTEADRVFLCDQAGINAYLVTIKSKDDLPEQNLYKLIKAGISFSDVNMSADFNTLEKSRLFRIKKELTNFIGQKP